MLAIISSPVRAFHAGLAAARRVAPLALGLLLCLLLLACSNFHEVEKDRFYRCAQPTEAQMARWIWRHDIRTVLRLRLGDETDEHYRASHDPAAAAGIDFVAIPISARRFPSKESMLGLCEVLDHGPYPILVHCRAGADRTGLVSAMYVLERTGDLELAREQLSFFPYLHLGWFGFDKADLMLDLYEPWHSKMSFCEWARLIYVQPENDEVPEGFLERERERAASWTPPAGAGPGS